MTIGVPNLDEVLNGQIYIGNLPAAHSLDLRKIHSITHVLSVCPDYPSTGPNHLSISVEDTEYANLLVHLPAACSFIHDALTHRGRVLVHCVMGISRSTTVVAAYLMKTRQITRQAAIRFIKQKRPKTHPNYGFIKQLDAFADCHYSPSPAHPAYLKWKRHHVRNVTRFLNQMIDTTPIIPQQLLLSSEFPTDPCQAESLLLDSGTTHLLTLSPARVPPTCFGVLDRHHHIELPVRRKDELLLALPEACKFVIGAIDDGGQVLVHCPLESVACVVVCASLMTMRHISPKEAYTHIEAALPLFNPTTNFYRQLDLFDACRHKPAS